MESAESRIKYLYSLVRSKEMKPIVQEILGHKMSIRDGSGGLKTFAIEDLFYIDETNLTQEFMRQAALYAYFSTLLSTADMKANSVDLMKDQAYAEADLYYREDADKNGRKITEPQVKSTVTIDEAYAKACERDIQMRYDVSILKSIVKALEQRAEMLISLGAHLRHEADMTGMNIRETAFEKSVDDVKAVLRASNSKKQV